MTHYYKYFWWGDERPGGKSDFHAVGNKGQYIYISPQKNVIIVRTGFDYGIPSSRWLHLFYQLADAYKQLRGAHPSRTSESG